MIQTNMHTSAHTDKDERGITLLIVLLIGTIMIFTSLAVGQYALRTVTAIRARSDATQTLYTAEQAFACVRYWLNKDYRHFSTIAGAVCNGVTYNFSTGSDTAADGHNPSYNSTTGIGTFRIPFDAANPTRGGVIVEVERTNPLAMQFDGYVRVYSQSDTETNKKTSERFQEYKYRVLYGADIMFVVDRSGSIDDGGNRNDRTLVTEWNEMLDAVNESIRLLNRKVPSPYMGLLSFGTDPTNTGRSVLEGVEPDVNLTDNIDLLIDDQGTSGSPSDEADDVPQMDLSPAATNLSLGIAIAGAELMGKYYPYNGTPPSSVLPFGENSGDFEKIVASGSSNFNSLPDQSPFSDRNDSEYPDVMVVITDGAPNGIMTHVQNVWNRSIVDSDNDFFDAELHTYEIGEAKIFRTPTVASGKMIIDEMSDVASGGNPATNEYQFCDDSSNKKPNTVFNDDPLIRSNYFPHMAMCNTTLIANRLKANGIIILAVYVGSNPTTPEAYWLQNEFVSYTDDGDPLFAVITNYSDLQNTLLYLFESLDFVQSR
ncbi:MAG: hypothetical protein UV60_C0012G0025 [Parcubacteria group bacterium GW2011_GWA2_43_11]|nr:MAG: hypothetical protein UU89_C0007G0007 [Parcubacteria group bacterium GW2011_GWC2_42_11]KKS85033.1 MAG: hypothetical protein UV60_C0012G0025 [Parcubacteria group bacterium GW2011_GWA2_43_11]